MITFIAAAGLLIACALLLPVWYFARQGRAVAYGGALKLGGAVMLIVAAAAGMYAYLGNREAMNPERTFSQTGDVAKFVDAVGALEKKAKEHPEDLQLQVMLARSYRAMGRYEEAVAAYGKAWNVIKDDPRELTLFAGVLALFRGEFKGKPDELLARALKIDPKNPDALMLAGGSAQESGKPAQAVAYWERALQTPNLDPEDKQWIEAQIAEGKKAMQAAPAAGFAHPPVPGLSASEEVDL